MASEFSVSILSSECPLDGAPLGVSALLPSGYLGAERGPIGQALAKALTLQDTNFDLRHVEPACVLGRVVEFNASQQGSCLPDPEHVLEALAEMGIEVVQDEMDAVSAAVDPFEE